ncbi:Fic family protein [Trueperella pyogenes]
MIADHPFADGNKRTGAALLGTNLRLTMRLTAQRRVPLSYARCR